MATTLEARLTAGPCQLSPDSVRFTAYFPGKQKVQLIGAFNGWGQQQEFFEDAGDGLWTCQRPIEPGDHRYQFVVDGVTICDPYAREVADASDDDPDAVPHAILRAGQPAFTWQHDRWQRPAFNDLVIYETHIGDFSGDGTFFALGEKLNYIRDMGFNAIQLMPITESALSEGWGYQPTYYFAPKRFYGSPDACKRLIDAAHGQGIAVIFDLVIAHSAGQHPFNQLYPYDQSPWFGMGIGGTNAFGLPTFDHRKPATQEFARAVQTFWLDEYHVDGFRYDYASNIGVDGENGLGRLAAHARAARPDAYLIGEYLPEDPKLTGIVQLNAIWHVRSSFALKALALQSEYKGYTFADFDKAVGVLDPHLEGFEAASHMINYVESHDEHRLVHELRDAGAGPDAARRRLALAATILMTMPGVPMVYHGQEFGEAAHLNINERIPLRWDLLQTTGGRGLHDHYVGLGQFRRMHPALRAEGFKIEATHNDAKWLVYRRWDDNGDVVVVAANFGTDTRRVPVPLHGHRTWHEWLRDQPVTVDEHGTLDVDLYPSEVALFTPHTET